MNSCSCTVVLCANRSVSLSYDIIESKTATGDQIASVFGILCQAAFSGGCFQQTCVRDISTSRVAVENLALSLSQNHAMPTHIYDIVTDFII